MPSRKQLQWSQLKVGISVVAASVTLAVLIFLMSGTGGLFTKKIVLKTYFDNANGLRVGAPVRLSGVDIGNVSGIRVVNDPGKQLTPVEVTMKVNTKYLFNLHKDSLTLLSTAGVLGETYIDIDSSQSRGQQVANGDTLPSREVPDFSDMVRSGQSTLQNMDALLKRLDRIIAFVESGQGSVGKLISDDELYQKVNGTVDRLNVIIDDLNAGKGTAGKLLKDPSLYNSANDTIANVKKLTDDVNAGKGALGTLTKDEEFARKLKDTVTKVSALSDRLEAGEGTFGKLLRDPSVYNNTDQMLIETRGLVKSIRENPKKYLTIHFRVF